jgi:predicted phage terminase large subunit-like protein
MGRYPDKRVIIVSYNTEFATRFGRRNVNKIKEFGKDIFGIELSKETAENFEIANNVGACKCAGILAGITGNPADLIIIDDPIKNREEADSDVHRNKMWDEYLNSVKTRLSANGKIIIIQTRWHEDDLAGRIIKQEGHKCKVVNFPVEAEENDILGREVGDALFPEIGKDKYWLEDFKLSYTSQEGHRAWLSLYQGKPSAIEGNLIKRDWFQFYDKLPDKFDRVCASWDCAFKDGNNNDYVVGQVWAMRGINCYLLDQIRGHMNLPTTVDAIEAMKDKYPGIGRIFVEDKANGSAVIQILQDKIPGVIAVNPEGGKVARASAISPHIESGHVFLPKFAPFLNEFMDECSAFPNTKHDDQVDAMTQAINRMMYYRSIEKNSIDYVEGGTYCRKELIIKGFRNFEITRMAKHGKIKLIGK